MQTRFEVTEKWESGEQFFYCNWVQRGGILLGCDGSLLTALDLRTGNSLGRYRGFNDANLLSLSDGILIFHGDGHLSTFKQTDGEMRSIGKFFVLDERCWVPPTPHGNFLYCRGGDQLLCLDLEGGDPRAAVTRARVRKSVLTFRATEDSSQKEDPMEQIVAAFESDGAEAARKTYNALREDDPDQLPYATRVELSEMAVAQQLHEFAKLIMQHAAEDFPQATKRAHQKPSTEATRGENGLVYLEFVIRNTSKSTIQAEVKGPAKHPFGYGLAIRPGQPRMEKWPVGTKLYQTVAGIRKDVLLTVKADFAGRTVEIPGQK
jgi:hypothetical protein